MSERKSSLMRARMSSRIHAHTSGDEAGMDTKTGHQGTQPLRSPSRKKRAAGASSRPGQPHASAGQTLSWLILVASVLGISALLVRLVGSDIGKAFAGFTRGIFGSSYAFSEVLVRAIPLILAGLGVAAGFSTGFFTIGAEGQIYLGAAAATATGMLLPGLPAWLLLPLAMLAGFAAGGIWSAIPGFLKARFGLSETINTIMFNYIAINIVGILVRTILKDPGYPLPMSPELPAAMSLPGLAEGTRLHAGLILAILAVAAMQLFMRSTAPGFTMRAVGMNARAARVAGIPVYTNLMLAAALSGGLAGLAGFNEIAGLHHKLMEGISPGFGYMAIIVALLGRNSAIGIAVAGLGIAALQVGSMTMQRQAAVPTSISWIIMGLLVLGILARPRFAEILDRISLRLPKPPLAKEARP